MIKSIQSFITRYWGRYKRLDTFSARYKVVTAMIALCVFAIFLNLFRLMVLDKDNNQQAAVAQQLKSTTIPANRGTIYDVNGEKLVQSAAAWVVNIEPKVIYSKYTTEECEAIFHTLSETLGVSYESVLERSRMNSSKVKILLKADKDQKDKLKAYIYRDAYTCKVNEVGENGKVQKVEKVFLAEEIASKLIVKGEDTYIKGKDIGVNDTELVKLNHYEQYKYIKGLSLDRDTNRYYYHDTPIAANVLGYTNFDNDGSQGIESYYNEELKGVDGKILNAQNSIGGDMEFDYEDQSGSIDGNSLTLTLDANVQSMLEKYLRQAVIDNDVQNHAAGIIMNVNTGAILAMATMPDYDPKDYKTITDPVALRKISEIEDPEEKKKATKEAQAEQWRNKAVNDTYEPGSVFKPITMSSALEEGVTNLDDTFNCPGYHLVGRKRIKCARVSGHGHETLTQAMMNSCNPVLMELGERLGISTFSKYFKSYGLTASTGIDLPGESAGMYHHEKDMTALDLAESAFGQSMTVTPIQMITAFSAVVNGGYLVKPYIVDKITDPKGNITRNSQTVIKRQVISEETSSKMRAILEATANKGGTAYNVYLPGYRIGGKTGTSEKIAKQAITKSKKSLYVASFCGVAPIDNPEVAILVVLDEPEGKRHAGGSIAAPVVRNIFSELLPYMGVDTIYSEEDMRLMDTLVPNVVGEDREEAVQALEKKGFTVRVLGNGDTVTAQTPSAAKSAPKSCTVVLTTESKGEIPTTVVPDLIGLSPSNVAYAVRSKNLNIRYAGTGYDSTSGISRTQDPPAGSVVEQGTVVTVEFTVDGIID